MANGPGLEIVISHARQLLDESHNGPDLLSGTSIAANQPRDAAIQGKTTAPAARYKLPQHETALDPARASGFD
jgi:hypothetical protein